MKSCMYGGGGFALDENRVRHNRSMQWDGRFDPADEVFAESAVRPLERRFPG